MDNDPLADTLTRETLLQGVAPYRTPAQRETVKALAARGRPRTRFNDDPFSGAGYWPKQVAFFLWHFLELDSRESREALRREFMLLREHEYCRCTKPHQDEPAPRGGSSIHGSRMPADSIILDLRRAYSAMPLHWQARTEVWLMMGGTHPDTIEDMRRNGKFIRAHRRRIAVESMAQTTMRGGLVGPVEYIAPVEGRMVWRKSIGATFAYWLNQTEREELAA